MNSTGQSLLEIIVAAGVAVLLIGGLVVGTTVSLRTSQYGERRSRAIKYAQEGIELTRSSRDGLPWDAFIARDTNSNEAIGTITCLGSDGVYASGPCGVNIGTAFTRSVSFNWNNTKGRMEVTVTVSWNEAGKTTDVTLDTYFTQWR